MKIKDKEELLGPLVSRIVENAPINDVVRVYGEAVTAAIVKLEDEELIGYMTNAGYTDLVEAYTEE
jgi:hypothetical protein